MRTYSEMMSLNTFKERYEYLRLDGFVGIETFGFDRYLNQRFYQSVQWRTLRRHIVARDSGLDLAFPGREIHAKLLIHHINPLTEADLREGSKLVLDPENLVTTCQRTHNAIHYGDSNLIQEEYVPRTPGDTKLW